MLIDTGNAPWNGTTNFGDSVLELTFPACACASRSRRPTRNTSTPTTRPRLQRPGAARRKPRRGRRQGRDHARARALAPGRALAVCRSTPSLGGEVQRLPLPGGGELFSAPAVWREDGRTTMFVADENATAAYVLRSGRLYQAWENCDPGTSPVMAGGLLYVYDPSARRDLRLPPGLAASDRQAPRRTPGTGTARSSSTGTWSSPRATPTTTSSPARWTCSPPRRDDAAADER